ncbi:response regulator [Sphingopyxis witflariensis]|uniref:Response regulator n=1 Tax=Sphingopyxis witflariensis TaxID=173675 RepID=A0A246JDD2_9SPHN|nr:response regulator [Sphingopyxis witflariensis]OWQ90653.1 response regulator [Sphingopyxis witflariensis]
MLIAREGWAQSPPSVLIVEDDPAVRRSLLLLLQGRGFAAKAWPEADPALAEAARAAPDCLIVDYRLEGRDGIAMLGSLRAQGWEGPAILISAYASEELSARAGEAGFALVLEKPLREHMLVDAVTRLTRNGTPSASP